MGTGVGNGDGDAERLRLPHVSMIEGLEKRAWVWEFEYVIRCVGISMARNGIFSVPEAIKTAA